MTILRSPRAQFLSWVVVLLLVLAAVARVVMTGELTYRNHRGQLVVAPAVALIGVVLAVFLLGLWLRGATTTTGGSSSRRGGRKRRGGA